MIQQETDDVCGGVQKSMWISMWRRRRRPHGRTTVSEKAALGEGTRQGREAPGFDI